MSLFPTSYLSYNISVLPNILLVILPSPPSLSFLSTNAFSLLFVPFHASSPPTFFFPPLACFLYPVLLSPLWNLSSVLTLSSSLHFSPTLFLCSLSLLRTAIYIQRCLQTRMCAPLQIFHSPAETKKWLMPIVPAYCISLPGLKPSALCPSSNTRYQLDWRINDVGNVPEFRSELGKAACSGWAVSRSPSN